MQEKFSKQEYQRFVFGLIALSIFGIFFCVMAFSTNDYKHLHEEFYYLNATFGRTDGLLVGDKVRMAGIDIGRVVDAKLTDEYDAVLKLEIDAKLKIPEDSSASIVSSGLMGSKYIEIEPGGSEEFLPNNGHFGYTQDALILQELLDRIVSIGRAKKGKQISQEEEENE